MIDRIKAAIDAKTDDDFVVMARTDALANEGLEGAIERALAYQEAGADALFPEAFIELNQYLELKNTSIYQFGKYYRVWKTPLLAAKS